MSNRIDFEALLSLIYERYKVTKPIEREEILPYVNDKMLAEDVVNSYRNIISEKNYLRKGKFLVVSGIDKSGKETQAISGGGCVKPLSKFLTEKGYRVYTIMQPSYETRLGGLIKYYLTENKKTIELAWMLWSLDRAQHAENVIRWLGEEKNIVLAKRWSESNVVYHVAKGIKADEIISFEKNIPKQDLTLILDIKPETSLKRNANPDAYENLGFLKLVWKNYINLNNYYPYGDKIYIEGEGDPCTVNFTLLSVVNDYLERQV